MVNEEIVGGLISALSRGEPLQKAMMTFYNAGYKKEEIEESARAVYSQVGAQTAKTGYIQNTIKTIASKVGLVKKDSQRISSNQEIIQKPSQEKMFDTKTLTKDKEKSPQKISAYGEDNYRGTYQNAEQITSKIERAIRDLKQINFPSKIEVINKNITSNPPTIVQKVSDYREGPPKQINKVITYLLVFLLILLLGVLAAVFFFKDELIKMFNNLGLS
ncbi:MAG: hypothetical protein AABY32_07290 [Nanoarchaeota archaeon]